MKNFKNILATYNEEDRNYIVDIIEFYTIFGSYEKVPETEEEFKNFCEERLSSRDRQREEEKEAKAKKEDKEKEKAAKLGMTAEEYKEYKKLQAKKTRYRREIKKAEEEIERLKKEVEWKKDYLKKLEERG